MDALLAEQHTTVRLIANAIDNFKKIGQDKRTVTVIQKRIELLSSYWDKCQGTHARMVQVVTEEQRRNLTYFKNDEFLLAEDRFLTALDVMQEELGSKVKPVLAVDVSRDQHSSVNSMTMTKLPKVELPKFSGDYTEWVNFKDLFESLVVNKTDLSNVEKLYYLKLSLTGEALTLLQNVAVTNENYESAWKTLIDQYDNKRAIINKQLSSLYEIPPVGSDILKDLKTLRERANGAVTALKNLGRSTDTWDDLLVFHLVRKLDKQTRTDWETKLGETVEYPKFSELQAFLNTKIRKHEALGTSTPPAQDSSNSASKTKTKTYKAHFASTAGPCFACSANHLPFQCAVFRSKSVSQRFNAARENKVCFNCLSKGHIPRDCPSKNVCFKCQRKHHTLLHSETKMSVAQTVQPQASNSTEGKAAVGVGTTETDVKPTAEQPAASSCTSHLCANAITNNNVLLATAWVKVKTSSGRSIQIRALLDQGSEATFITKSVVQALRAPRQNVQAFITGLGGKKCATARAMAALTIAPCQEEGPGIPIRAIVLPQLTAYRPVSLANVQNWEHFQDIKLADAHSYNAAQINLLIGADRYSAILLDGLRKGKPTEPIAQKTIFGWVISGPTGEQSQNVAISSLHCEVFEKLDLCIRRFSETEELPQVHHLTAEQKKCDEHFEKTHSRDRDTGKYIVRLPFKSDLPIAIGESYNSAAALFLSLERKLSKQTEQSKLYKSFIEEFVQLGQMRVVDRGELIAKQCVYLSHHPVMRADSTTTKLRVVFNASLPTSNGTSLNDHLLVGPKLQADIVSIILQWRIHCYVYAADIEKMFRQIWVDKRDTSYQLILWRATPGDALQTYMIKTVAYGMVASPYLANKVIKQLVLDEGNKFPLAVPVLSNQIYVDDVFFGADDRIIAQQTRVQVTEMLSLAGLHLRKWVASEPALLPETEFKEKDLASTKMFQEEVELKMLGIYWSPLQDEFRFKINLKENTELNKRSVLSIIGQLYDPLGWITPFVITAKIFMQKLWAAKLDWNEPLPEHLAREWDEFYSHITLVEQVTIPRWVGLGSTTLSYSIHGFSDASKAAYAAVVYLRVDKIPNEVQVTLLMAKSRVAPLKPLSIPRLELVAALLLTILISSIQTAMQLARAPVYCWTDSTVTLAWIKQHPSTWPTFVANRVAEIQTLTSTASWRHVPTSSNPADCASRGVGAQGLLDTSIWWQGPDWLTLSEDQWPNTVPLVSKSNELGRKQEAVVHLVENRAESDLPERFSSWHKLLRVTSYILRFIAHARGKRIESLDLTLKVSEIQNAKTFWIKYVQKLCYSKELADLKRNHAVSSKSSLISYTPFLDENETIRVGGRLRNAPIPYNQQCQIILPQHRIAELIITDCHTNTLHGGIQLMLCTLRQNFWIMHARNLVKRHIHNCVTCVRDRAKTNDQLMGNLPAIRVTPARPFAHSGVDYAGPLTVRYNSGRGQKSHKAYLALFVCLVTRAIHLEIVSDYSTESFLAAFNRFAARRGRPAIMYSDNGTNFRGADKELTAAFKSAIGNADFRNHLASDGTEWVFIPPAAPHFGGIWEAGVKSVKIHLRRVLGANTPTLEELNTLTCQIEACLNSRPIGPLTDDVENLDALTPGHFLIGGPLTTPPTPSLLNLTENRLSRWQLMRQMLEKFWKIRSTEYLQSLQRRFKWSARQANLKVGDLVLVKNPSLPPMKWDLGRVVECHKGQDELTRVVRVKTAQSEYVRPITQLCKLPIEPDYAVNNAEFITE